MLTLIELFNNNSLILKFFRLSNIQLKKTKIVKAKRTYNEALTIIEFEGVDGAGFIKFKFPAFAERLAKSDIDPPIKYIFHS